jgi:hypothetical protein
MRLDNDLSQPGMPANIDIDGAVKRANTALHTSGWIRHYLPGREDFSTRYFRSKQGSQTHNIYISRFLSGKVTADWRKMKV